MSASEPDLTDAERAEVRKIIAARQGDPVKDAQRATADAAVVAERKRVQDAAAALEAPVAAARAALEDALKALPPVGDPGREGAYKALMADYDAEVAKVHGSKEWQDLHRDGDAEVARLMDARKAVG